MNTKTILMFAALVSAAAVLGIIGGPAIQTVAAQFSNTQTNDQGACLGSVTGIACNNVQNAQNANNSFSAFSGG
jgi:hypothetical protein